MKYKIIGIILTILMLMLSLIAPLMEGEKCGRVWQHREAKGKIPCEHTKPETLCTHLPIVVIDTEGVEIPGKPLPMSMQTLKYRTLYSKAADGSTTIAGKMKVVDHENEMNHPEDETDISSNIRIRVRGDSSRKFNKVGYAVRLIKEDGSNNPLEIMGMDSHHEWVLHGPYLDKTLMRNYLSYNLAGEIMDYAPNVRFCELILNGKYQGVYVMTESITAGNDGARLSMDVTKSDHKYTGYLLRLDNPPLLKEDALNSFSDYTMRTPQSIEIYYPGKSQMTPEMKEAIKDDFSAFEKALYSYDYDSKKYGYESFIDVESFVDYFLISELTYNGDTGGKSTYIYKGADNRYRMCVWDFNNAFDNFQEGELGFKGFFMTDVVWYAMLLKDEDFAKQVVTRYRMLRETTFNEDYLMACIDETDAYLGDAVNRNFAVWNEDLTTLYEYDRNCGDHEEEIGKLKIWLHQRLLWMDENIETLYQYSAESSVKNYDENPE